MSYNAVLIQISKRKTKKCKWCCCCCCHGSEANDDVEAPEDYCDLILEKDDRRQFKMEKADLQLKLKTNSSYWNIPINQACPLVRDKLDDNASTILGAIIKFQESLENLIQFHENPFPPLCIKIVTLACWMYVALGSFALQFCSGRDRIKNDIFFVSLIFFFKLHLKEYLTIKLL